MLAPHDPGRDHFKTPGAEPRLRIPLPKGSELFDLPNHINRQVVERYSPVHGQRTDESLRPHAFPYNGAQPITEQRNISRRYAESGSIGVAAEPEEQIGAGTQSFVKIKTGNASCRPFPDAVPHTDERRGPLKFLCDP